MPSELTINITKTFPGRLTVHAAFGMSLEPPAVMILFGPSGAGKTTVLRCLAGLESPEQGAIRFGSDTWLDTATGTRCTPQQRQVGCVFQDYALFPTHTVAGNIAFGLGSLTPVARQQRVAEVLALVRLEGTEHLRPDRLSGGQQQRVALARALAPHPRLLLLDEPLSALDVPTRTQLRGELRHLLKQLRIPSVVVTHDWGEALALGDAMAVMSEGRILQVGTPQEVFNRPQNSEVARLVGMDTAVPGLVIEASNGLVTVEVAGVRLQALGTEDTGSEVFVCIRAEDVLLETEGAGTISARNRLPGIVRELSPSGASVRVGIECGFSLTALVTRAGLDELKLTPGARVVAAIKAGAVQLVPRRDATA